MNTIPVINVDLTLPPEKRWQHVPVKLCKAAKTLTNRAADQVGGPRKLTLAERLMDAATAVRNPYRAEIAAWASLADLPRRRALLSNMSYELSGAGYIANETIIPSVSDWLNRVKNGVGAIRGQAKACTSGAAYYPACGMVHVRAMDWTLAGLGRHTVIWHVTGGEAGDYYNIGWPGYVGVISGMAPGRFSATINQASPFGKPSLQWPPSHLLRYVFDNAADYDDAITILEGTPVCFPAFVTLVGTQPGEAAIIELTPEENRVYPMTRKQPIAIANDYLSGDWRAKFGETDRTIKPHLKGNTSGESDSENRRNAMLAQLKTNKPDCVEGVIDIIREIEPLDNECTVQLMAFLPATGQCLVIGQEEQEPACVGGV